MSREEIRITLLSDPRLLCCVRAMVRTYVGNYGFAPDRTEEVVLAVDEACTNAIRHSYAGRHDEPLELALGVDDEHLKFVLRDRGRPAPPECATRREAEPATTETVAPGGLGLHIIHRVFDDVTYEPGHPAGNCVTMRLRRPPA